MPSGRCKAQKGKVLVIMSKYFFFLAGGCFGGKHRLKYKMSNLFSYLFAVNFQNNFYFRVCPVKLKIGMLYHMNIYFSKHRFLDIYTCVFKATVSVISKFAMLIDIVRLHLSKNWARLKFHVYFIR